MNVTQNIGTLYVHRDIPSLIVTATNKEVADTTSRDFLYSEHRQHAALIVKAVNAHDRLIADLREIMEQSARGSWYYQKAKAALAAAGEQV